jgi:hypothetical protein
MMRLPIRGGLMDDEPSWDCGSGLSQKFVQLPLPVVIEFSI